METTYPLDIVHVKMFVQRKLLDSVREASLKTTNNFPSISLDKNNNKFIENLRVKNLNKMTTA